MQKSPGAARGVRAQIGRKTNYGLWEWLDPGIDHGWSFIPDVSWGIVEWGIHPDKKK